MSNVRECPEYCFTGSTEFYDSASTDEYTPSYLEAKPLEFNVGTRSDGTIPNWITPGSPKSPILQYVEWFNGIWHTGDPSSWNATVFTNNATMIDPSGTWHGAQSSANSFLLLFKYYPELRGEVVSWAANDREIMINWRFEVKQRNGGPPLLVPVIDKFCFVDGRVSFRLAYYDLLTFIGYLTDNYGLEQLMNYLRSTIPYAKATGGIQNVPILLWNVIKGLFVWPYELPMCKLRATPGDGSVTLTWEAVADATSYTVNRSTDLNGPFEPPPGNTNGGKVTTNSYIDANVTNGVTYWYLVSPNYQQWKPVPVARAGSASPTDKDDQGHRHQLPYGISRGTTTEPVPAEGAPYKPPGGGPEHKNN